MSKPLQIGIDVDLTWVDSGTAWIVWMEKMYNVKVDWTLPPENPQGLLYYNVSKYFPTPSAHQLAPYDFWEEQHLYDGLHPRAGAIEALRDLVAAGHFAHFISMCKKGHFSSKVRHIKRYTEDFMSIEPGSGHGFYATKNKSMLRVDVIIDDRNSFLNQFPDDVIKIKFATPYDQDEPLRSPPALETDNWLEIRDFLLGIE